MIIIEFPKHLTYGVNNIIKYRDIDDNKWHYLYVDIETLNLLILNFGILSSNRIPLQPIYTDNSSTGKNISVKYCGAKINMRCGNNSYVSLSSFEGNY